MKKVILAIITVILLSVGAYFLCDLLGITDIETLRNVIASCGVWGWLVFLLIQIVLTTFLCVIPGTSALLIGVAVAMFGSWKAFLICSVGVFLSSTIMFLLGHFVGEKIAIKLVGKKDLEKAQELVDVKSKIFLPLMFLFPVFPDDALCLVAGMTKMKYWYFAIIVAVCRTIGIATICFLGSDFILNMFLQMNYLEMFMLINIFAIDIIFIIKTALKIEKKIKDKAGKEKEND